jgi:hypothetical protein
VQISEREMAKLRLQISQLPKNSVIIKEAAAALARLIGEKGKADILKEGIVEQISKLPLSVSFVKAEESLNRTRCSRAFSFEGFLTGKHA